MLNAEQGLDAKVYCISTFSTFFHYLRQHSNLKTSPSKHQHQFHKLTKHITMSSNSGSIGDQIKSGVKEIHGVGEAIRGTVMSETDKAFGTADRPGAEKNEAIAQRGLAETKQFDQNVGQKHGIGSDTTKSVPAGSAADTVPATQTGVHSTAPGDIGSTGSTVGRGTAGVQETPGVNQRF